MDQGNAEPFPGRAVPESRRTVIAAGQGGAPIRAESHAVDSELMHQRIDQQLTSLGAAEPGCAVLTPRQGDLSVRAQCYGPDGAAVIHRDVTRQSAK